MPCYIFYWVRMGNFIRLIVLILTGQSILTSACECTDFEHTFSKVAIEKRKENIKGYNCVFEELSSDITEGKITLETLHDVAEGKVMSRDPIWQLAVLDAFSESRSGLLAPLFMGLSVKGQNLARKKAEEKLNEISKEIELRIKNIGILLNNHYSLEADGKADLSKDRVEELKKERKNIRCIKEIVQHIFIKNIR